MCQISLYYQQSFDTLSDQQIKDYAFFLREENKSDSTIKFILFAYGFYFKVNKLKDRKVPYIRSKKKVAVPAILNQEQIKLLVSKKNRSNVKHRLILCLLYSCGIRVGELLALKPGDIDYVNKRICIQKGKGGIRRYVVLSSLVEKGLEAYFSLYKPKTYLFESKQAGQAYSSTSVGVILKEALKKANIPIKISVHGLRHCFAVHYLEQGGNIVLLKDQLGHSNIKTTLIYLRVAKATYQQMQSPLDVVCKVS